MSGTPSSKPKHSMLSKLSLGAGLLSLISISLVLVLTVLREEPDENPMDRIFVFSFLAFFIFAFSSFLMGAVSILDTTQPSDKTLARAGLRLGIFAFLLMSLVAMLLPESLLLPRLNVAREKARRISCSSNLKQIGLALQQYAMDANDKFPPGNGVDGFEYLRKESYLMDHTIYMCPSIKTPRPNIPQNTPLSEKYIHYVYAGSGLTANDSPDSPIAWDKPNNHRKYGNVLFLDGHVQGFSGVDWLDQAQKYRSKK